LAGARGRAQVGDHSRHATFLGSCTRSQPAGTIPVRMIRPSSASSAAAGLGLNDHRGRREQIRQLRGCFRRFPTRRAQEHPAYGQSPPTQCYDARGLVTCWPPAPIFHRSCCERARESRRLPESQLRKSILEFRTYALAAIIPVSSIQILAQHRHRSLRAHAGQTLRHRGLRREETSVSPG
jgi:hypothetical protein